MRYVFQVVPTTSPSIYVLFYVVNILTFVLKYSALEPLYHLAPVTVEIVGPWSSEGCKIFKELDLDASDRGCEHHSELWLVQQLSIVIQRGIMGIYEPLQDGILVG